MDLVSLFRPFSIFQFIFDQSLALALYFASRGKGQVRREPDLEPVSYVSEARVLLNGLGSDELLGGYGRHRSAYNSGGWQAVISEANIWFKH